MGFGIVPVCCWFRTAYARWMLLPLPGMWVLVEAGCCRVVVGPFSQSIQVAWTSSLSKGGSAGHLVIRGCLGPWEPVLDSHWGGQSLVGLTAFRLWSSGFSPHVGHPPLSCLDEHADVTEMYGLRSSVLLGAADCPGSISFCLWLWGADIAASHPHYQVCL